MKFYRRNGEYIHYEICGEGFPVVFLHGNNLESGYFKKQRVLSKYCKLIFVDSLGHGKSGDLLEKVSFLNIEKCLLVGHSDGANLAIEFAKLHGKRVAGIIANSGNISFDGLKFLPKYACFFEEYLYKALGIFFPVFKRRSVVSPLLHESLDISKDTFKNADYPVIVLVGDHDMIKRSHSISISKLFPHGKFIERKNQGHNIPKKDSIYFNKTVYKLVQYILRR